MQIPPDQFLVTDCFGFGPTRSAAVEAMEATVEPPWQIRGTVSVNVLDPEDPARAFQASTTQSATAAEVGLP